MIKKEIFETEHKSVGLQKVQGEILDTYKRIDSYRDSLKKLTDQKTLMIAKGQTESDEYKKNNADILKLNKSIREQKNLLRLYYKQLNFSELSLKELRIRASELTKELGSTSKAADPERYSKLRSELDQVNRQMDKTRMGMKVAAQEFQRVPSMWSKAWGQVKNFLPAIGIGALITKAMGSVRSEIDASISKFRAYDEAITDASKTTDLTKHETEELSQSLAKIDTRTAQNELLNLARVGGKLGISGKADVEAFVRAADKINVALSEDLGGNAEAAITQIGKLVDIFGLKQEFGIEDSMIRVASAINEAGMASTANEAYIVNFSKRVAGIAPNADISIQNTIGLAATLDQLGQTAETSATVYGQVVMKMFRDTDTYARLAGMGVKEFSELLRNDANAAFIALLKGVRGNAEGMETIVKNLDDLSIRGARGSQVIGTLVKNVEILEKQQQIANEAFEDGTSVIEEFNKKNTSADAIMEKSEKRITAQAVALGQKFLPVANAAKEATASFLSVINSGLGVLIQYKASIIVLTTATTLYIAVKKLQNFWSKENRKAILEESRALNVKTLSTKADTVATANNIKNTKAATAGTRLLSAAKLLLTGQFKAAIIAVKGFFAALGPIGWAITAVTALTTVVTYLRNRTTEATEAQKRLEEAHRDTVAQISTENTLINVLFSRLKSAKEGTNEYEKAKKAILDKYGVYLDGLNEEIKALKDVKGAYEAITKAAKESIIERMKSQQLEAAASTAGDAWSKALTNMDQGLQNYFKEGSKHFGKELMPIVKEALEAENTTIYDDTTAAHNRIITALQNKAGKIDGGNLHNMISGYIDDYMKASAVWEETKSDIERTLDSIHQNEENTDTLDAPPVNPLEPNGDKDKNKTKWSLNSDKEYLEELRKLKEKYLAGDIATEKEYKDLLLKLDMEHLDKRIKKNVDDEQHILTLKNQLTDKWLEQKKTASDQEDKLNKLIAQSHEDLTKKEEEAHKQRLKDYGLAGVEKEQMTKAQQEAIEAVEREHHKNLSKIQNDAVNKAIKERQSKFESQLNQDKIDNNNELAEIKTLQEAKALLKDKYDAKDLANIRTLADARSRIQKEQNKKLEADTVAHLEKFAEELRALVNGGKFDGINLNNALLSKEQKQELEKRIADVKLQMSELVATAQELEGDGKSSYSSLGGKADILGLTPEDWEVFFENLENGRIGIEDMIALAKSLTSAFQQYDTFLTASENKQLKKTQKANDEKKRKLQERLNAGRMSQEQYTAAVQALDDEYDKQQEKMQLKQAKRKKAISIVESIINTAVAVTSVVANPILAAMVGALGAAQTALIVAQPIAGRETGSFLVEREQDGKMFNAEFAPNKRGLVNKPTVIVGENGNEYVIPASGFENPTLTPIIRTIKEARLRGNLRDFNFSRLNPVSVTGKETGGFVNSTSNPSGSQSEHNSTVDPVNQNLLQVLQKLSSQLDHPLQAIVSYLGKNGLKEKMEEYDRTRNKGKIA